MRRALGTPGLLEVVRVVRQRRVFMRCDALDADALGVYLRGTPPDGVGDQRLAPSVTACCLRTWRPISAVSPEQQSVPVPIPPHFRS